MKTPTTWDLTPLFKSDRDPEIKKARDSAILAADVFRKKWEQKDNYLKNPVALKKALDDYEKLIRTYGFDQKENYYFSLRRTLDQNSPHIKAADNKATDIAKILQNAMQFFELRLAKIDTRLQNKFLAYKPLAPYKHFLQKLFETAKYQLSEPEEKIMNIKHITSHTNWVRMLDAFLAKEEVKVLDEDGKKKVKTFSDLLGLMSSKNKKVRDKAAEEFNTILEKYTDVAENEINSVLQNKKGNDEIRGYTRPDKARHVGDDIETEVIDALVSAVSKHFVLSKRYYKLKAKLMGVPKLGYHERNVEYGKINKNYSYAEAVEVLTKVFGNLDNDFKVIFRGFVDEGRIDVYPKKGKAGGAFCTYSLITHPTYSLLNWTDKLNDVLTFAHELGHGINFELVKKNQNSLNFGTTVATTEVASTFMEDFVLEELKKDADDELHLALNMMKLNDEVSTIFRQIAFYNFETDLHKQFRKVGYLSSAQIGKLFQKHMASYMGSAVEQSDGSQNWWIYVNHFRYFFYVYSYASGLLISKSLQAGLKENPKYIHKVKSFLAAGLSESPKDIFAKLGINITDKTFWAKGLSEVEVLLTETEKLAKRLGKI